MGGLLIVAVTLGLILGWVTAEVLWVFLEGEISELFLDLNSAADQVLGYLGDLTDQIRLGA